MKILKIFLGFLLGFLLFTAIGYFFYTKLSEPNNSIIFLLFSHIGLVAGIYFAKKTIPKKVLSSKPTDKPLMD